MASPYGSLNGPSNDSEGRMSGRGKPGFQKLRLLLYPVDGSSAFYQKCMPIYQTVRHQIPQIHFERKLQTQIQANKVMESFFNPLCTW
jgi:hypothetical protein